MSDEEDVKKEVGKCIQQLRQAKGYTQQELAEIVGISSNFLSDVERGKNAVGIGNLVAIINALECSADEIFSKVTNNGYKVKASKLSDALEQLPTQERERFSDVFEALTLVCRGDNQ